MKKQRFKVRFKDGKHYISTLDDLIETILFENPDIDYISEFMIDDRKKS